MYAACFGLCSGHLQACQYKECVKGTCHYKIKMSQPFSHVGATLHHLCYIKVKKGDSNTTLRYKNQIKSYIDL